jgi:hypothetical protein
MQHTQTVTPHGGFNKSEQMKDNKLIAEFMGFQHTPIGWYDAEECLPFKYENTFDILRFDVDWNWLIPVVEKIESTKYFNSEIQFSITKYAVSIQSIDKNGVIISPCIFSKQGTFAGTEKRNAIYIACVEFIKWYYKND